MRLVSTLSQDSKKVMIFCTQSEQEQQLVLQAVKQFGEVMNSGKELAVVIKKRSKNVGTIEVSVVDSKETY